MKKAALMLLVVMVHGLPVMVSPAVAQDNYPSSQIRVVVGFAAGGSTDLNARLMAQNSELLIKLSDCEDERVQQAHALMALRGMVQ